MLVCGCLWVCVYVLSLYGQDLALYQRFNYYYYVHTLYKRQRGNYIKKINVIVSLQCLHFKQDSCLHFKQAQTTLKAFLFIFTILRLETDH